MNISDTPLVSCAVSQRSDEESKLKKTQQKQMEERLVEKPADAWRQSLARHKFARQWTRRPGVSTITGLFVPCATPSKVRLRGLVMLDNPWKPSLRMREPAQLIQPIIDSAGWTAKELEGTDAWVYHLSDAEVVEIHSAVDAIEANDLELKFVTRENFRLPRLSAALADIKAELRDGRGLALIRGLPIEGRTRKQIAIAFWGLGHYMGQAKSQNHHGHLLGHVTDIGGDVSKQRGYMSNAGLKYHTDRADILSLCCCSRLNPAARTTFAAR